MYEWSKYPEKLFRRRFGVARALLWRLHRDLLSIDSELRETIMVVGSRTGIRSHEKVLSFLRVMRTGEEYDRLYDVKRMGADAVRVYFRRFTTDILYIYRILYLKRKPRIK